MTHHRTSDAPRLLRAALLAYPRTSRAAHAQELTAIFAEATGGAGRIATLREAVDVAGHGLRLRGGLGGPGRADEVVARAAPAAVALCAAQGVAYVVALGVMLLDPPQFRGLGTAYALVLGDAVGATVVWLGVVALLLLGRWGGARILGALGTAAQVPVVLAALPGLQMDRTYAVCQALLPSLFVAALLLAVPRDLTGPLGPRDRSAMGWAVLSALVLDALMFVVELPYVTGILISFVWFVPVAWALLRVRRDATGPAALALTAVVGLLRFGVPMLAQLTSPREVAAAAVVLAAVAFAWRRRSLRNAERPRPSRSTGPSRPSSDLHHP
ncbi:hypothetical protein [Streptacidiphilus neutrinimicus]|uniref:hypothetical protein n=1 Tax=Streptacidiphilus neutrinimicus TaxID=105420 RepID=UPI0005AB5858|nr:hypothetical protein [Streptacidiphilus neutrinimicus]